MVCIDSEYAVPVWDRARGLKTISAIVPVSAPNQIASIPVYARGELFIINHDHLAPVQLSSGRLIEVKRSALANFNIGVSVVLYTPRASYNADSTFHVYPKRPRVFNTCTCIH